MAPPPSYAAPPPPPPYDAYAGYPVPPVPMPAPAPVQSPSSYVPVQVVFISEVNMVCVCNLEGYCYFLYSKMYSRFSLV